MIFQEDKYCATFPSILRDLMECHPKTKEMVTQKKLAEYLGIRPQTVSLYKNGSTQPTPYTLVKIAEYFGVSVDYLLTGVSSENKKINEELGLSETAVTMLRTAKKTDNFENCEKVIDILNDLLSDRDFYVFLEDMSFKIAAFKALKNIAWQEREKAYNGINIIGYHAWDMQKYIEEFIQNEMSKRDVDIKSE